MKQGQTLSYKGVDAVKKCHNFDAYQLAAEGYHAHNSCWSSLLLLPEMGAITQIHKIVKAKDCKQ